MPLGQFADFADCVAKSGDKGDPKAYCAALERAAKGKMAESAAAVKLTRQQIEKACPKCASEMKKRGFSALKLTEAALNDLPAGLLKLLFAEASGPDFLATCTEQIAPETNTSDPAAFCAWLHDKLTGLWPGMTTEARETPVSEPRLTDFSEIFERGVTLREAKVDRSTRVISNVTLLGKTSKNNRSYSPRAMEEAVRLMDGAPFYLDHPSEQYLKEHRGVRSVMDLAGEVRNPRLVGDLVRGDLHILDREPVASMVFALAEQMPNQVGNSHRAKGMIRPGTNGTGDVVESLSEVKAVELVTDPATTAGLFESVQGDDMDYKVLTAADLKRERPDLVAALVGEAKTEIATRETLIAKKLAEAKLPAPLVTESFRRRLVEAKDEAAIDVLVAEAKELAPHIGKRAPAQSVERVEKKAGEKKAPVDVEEAALPDLAKSLGVRFAEV